MVPSSALQIRVAFSSIALKTGASSPGETRLEDQSGDFAAATIGKVHGIELATDEINAAGGIAGRPIELVVYDTQSDNTRYQEFMRRVLQRDKVDVVFAGFSCASREAYRPIVNQFDGLAFYNNQYEGGVCDANMIVTGAVPEQQFSTLIPWMMETYGKKVYTIAADYNFGQISAEWVRNIVKENGGEMVGEEFIPLGVSQFSQTIQNIQAAKPDFVVTLLVGAAQASYYEQAAAANLGCRWRRRSMSARATSTSASRRRASPTCTSRPTTSRKSTRPRARPSSRSARPSSRTSPTSTRRPRTPTLAIYLYKQMVERAEGRPSATTIRKVIAEGDVCFDAPEGKVCLDPKSQHMSHTIYLAKVGDDHSIDLPEGLGRHQALLARRRRLRPDEERSDGAVHAEQSADRTARLTFAAPGSDPAGTPISRCSRSARSRRDETCLYERLPSFSTSPATPSPSSCSRPAGWPSSSA